MLMVVFSIAKNAMREISKTLQAEQDHKPTRQDEQQHTMGDAIKHNSQHA
jgi:hypothetical protein